MRYNAIVNTHIHTCMHACMQTNIHTSMYKYIHTHQNRPRTQIEPRTNPYIQYIM